jgi:hypothetical protein
MTTNAEQRKKKLLQQLNALKSFSNTKAVRKLREELGAKLAQLEKHAITKAQGSHKQTRLPISKSAVKRLANESRAVKLRKYHNYVRQIHQNYPNLTYGRIRKQFRERKTGKKSKIPDVIWRNPSP